MGVASFNRMRKRKQEAEETPLPPPPIEQPKKEFVCEVCGVSFTHHLALAGHMRKHK